MSKRSAAPFLPSEETDRRAQTRGAPISRRDAVKLTAGASAYLAVGGCNAPEHAFGVLAAVPPSEEGAPALAMAGDDRGPAVVSTFYVDSVSGNDDNAGTAPGAAWRTLNMLEAGTVRAGDTVIFLAGSAFSRDENTEGKFWFEDGIHYTGSDPDNRPVFAGTGNRPFGIRGTGTTLANLALSGGTLSVLHTDGRAPVQVGLTNVDCVGGGAIGFQQLLGGGVGIDSSFTIAGGSYSNNGKIGINLTGARDTVVDRVTASGNGTVGIRLQSSGANCVIQNCTANGNGSNGIGVDNPQTGGGNEIVRGNTVFENSAVTDDTSGIKTFSKGTIVCYNRVYDNGLGGTINHGIQLEAGSEDCECYGNLCYGNLTAGISFTGSGHRLYHNTCHANGETGIAIFSSAVSDCEVKNNLLVDNGRYSFLAHASVTITNLVLDYNLHESSRGAAKIRYDGIDHTSIAALNAAVGQEANGLEGGSRIQRSLRVPRSSAATGAGDPSVGLSHDFDGDPYRNPPTIGACETLGRGD